MSLINCKVVADNVSYETYSRQEPGVKRGDSAFVMSRSELVEFYTCPKRWLDGYGLNESGNNSTEWGSLLDCLITSKEAFDSLFAVCPETYTNKKGEQSEWRNDRRIAEVAAFLDENEGKTIIKADVYAEAQKAAKLLLDDPEISELLSISRKQVLVTGFWRDRGTGIEIPIRALLDLVPPASHPRFGKRLCDSKTARNGNPANWNRVVDDNSYDVQAALHFDLYCAATGEDRAEFSHLVQENVPPYHVVKPVPALSEEFLQWGRVKYQAALIQYAQCLKIGEWPSFAPAGFVFGGLQFINPDELWNYRKVSGGAGLIAAIPQAEPRPVYQSDDITP